MTLAFFKKKSVLITLGIVVVVGGLIWRSRAANAGPFYDTQAVEKRTLNQTVEVTGETKPQARVELSFETSGKLDSLSVIVGQTVKAGDVLATLDSQEATFAMRRAGASVAQAQASLAARQAQDSPQAIQIAEAQRDQAKANLEKAKADAIQVQATSAEQVRLAQIAVETAQQNIVNSGTGADLGVQTSKNALRASLVASDAALSSALIEGDAILGVENTAANDAYENVLGIYDSRSLFDAQGKYQPARTSQRRASTLIKALTSNSTASELIAAGQATMDALQLTQSFLDGVQKVLTNSGTNGSFTTTDLAAKRSAVQTARTTVASQFSTVSSAVSSLQTAGNSQTTTDAQLETALKTAQANLTIAIANQVNQVKSAQTAIEIQTANLTTAEATLSQRKTPARNVDLQVIRAQLQDAQIAYEQAVQRVADTQLRAPVEGTIAEILPARGEQIVQNQKVMGLVVTSGYSVEASVPEADIAKVKQGQTATVTLDAYGDEVKFSATVLSIEPDRIKSQDAVFYKVALALNPSDREIRPGLTANVTISSGEAKDALVIPIRAVRSEGGTRSVRILVGEEVKEVDVELGLRGDDGQVQVLQGLNEGDQVIVGELTAAEYSKKQADAKAAKY